MRAWLAGLGHVDDNDLGVVAERTAEAKPEVHRHADDDRHVGALQRLPAHAREEQLAVGRHAAARQAVEEHRDAQRLRERQQRLLPVAPVEVAAGHDHRALGLREEKPGRPDRRARRGRARALREAGPLAVLALRTRRVGRLHEHVVHREVDERRTAVRRERGAERLVDQRGDLLGAFRGPGQHAERAHKRNVVDLLQRSHPPAPRRRTAAEPSIGEWLACAEAIALIPFVTPGPAVSAHTPGSRVTFAQPSAANAAVDSWRTSTISIPSARTLIDREQVPAAQREQPAHAVGLQPARDQPPAAERLHPLLAANLAGHLPATQRSRAMPGWGSNPHTLASRVSAIAPYTVPPPGPRGQSMRAPAQTGEIATRAVPPRSLHMLIQAFAFWLNPAKSPPSRPHTFMQRSRVFMNRNLGPGTV